MSNKPPLIDKTIIVTGAASGIGAGTVATLCGLGAHVIAFDINEPTQALRAAEGAEGQARAHVGDVRSEDAWREVVGAALESHGRIDGLANVAGIVRPDDTVIDVSRQVWSETIETNLVGTFNGMRAVLPVMLKQEAGSIVNTSSTAATRGTPGLAAYSASKGAIEALTRQAATEYAATGVRINAVAPGAILTPILINPDPSHVPAGRVGNPADIGGAVGYLMSDAAAYVTGIVLPVDGGLGSVTA